VVQVEELLLYKHKAPGSNPSPIKGKKRKETPFCRWKKTKV
jgi:hypothetical protein